MQRRQKATNDATRSTMQGRSRAG